jgi:hypothetical protein
VDFVWLLLAAGIILAIARELQNVVNKVYAGMTLTQSIIYFIGSVMITIASYIIFVYFLPLLMYKAEFAWAKVKGNFKKFAYLVAMLGPLYSTAILIKAILDFLLPDMILFNFIKIITPGLILLYIFSIMFVAIRNYFKLVDVKAVMLTSIPWLIIIAYNLI